MNNRDEVLQYFGWPIRINGEECPHDECHIPIQMADEIVRLREQLAAVEAEREALSRILAALREPSEAVVNALRKHIGIYSLTTATEFTDAFTAAVAAAEREVN